MSVGSAATGLRGRAVRLTGAALAGGLSAFAYAPFELFPLSILSLALLLRLLLGATRARGGFALGLAWGLGTFLAGVSWLYISLNRYGGMAPPLAGLAVVLFCAYLALFPALAASLFVRWRARLSGRWSLSLLFAALWLLSELLRSRLFTGFPWLAVGYSQTVPSPLAGYFPLLGVFGVGFLAAWLAAWLVLGQWRQQFVSAVLPFVAVCAVGAGLQQVQWAAPSGAPVSVALIQSNIDQALKWAPERLRETLQILAQQVQTQRADITVLPETAFPLLLDQVPASYLAQLTEHVRGHNGDLVFGVFVRDPQGRIFNSAVTAGVSTSQSYAKQHLVPFGEYSPPAFGWFYRFVNIAMSNQTPGEPQQAPLQLGAQQVAVNICYEDLFGHEIIRSLPQATLMLNLSNLAWYGNSWAQPQHLQIAQVRAQETGRPMLRATNTGMTALVLPSGRVEAVLPAFERAVLRVDVQGYEGRTPYSYWGDWPAIGLCGLLLAWSALRRRAGRNAP